MNIFVGTKMLIYIGLSKYYSHLLHQNMIIVGAILHQNMMFMVDVVEELIVERLSKGKSS